MTFFQKNIGKTGEDLAVKYLLSNGYRIIFRNYRFRAGEIDIIAEKNFKLSFIEVKTRVGLKKGYPYEAINKRKISHINLAANSFLLQNNYKNYKLSLDFISVILNEDLSVNEVKYYKNIEL